MSKSTRPSNVEIAKSAILRAAGFDWSQIGVELNRSAARIRHWPIEFPDFWKYCYLLAQLRFVLEAAGEAERILQALADGPDGAGQRLAQRELSRFHLLREQVEPAAELASGPAADPPNGEPLRQPACQAPTYSDEFMKNMFERYIDNLLERERQLANRDSDGSNPIFIGYHYD